ncbi:MAG: toll/interleukin-1 receptor domain-containing protein [Chloroflexaceae bacterium]
MIFICYSWADALFVRNLTQVLDGRGQHVWIDYTQLDLDQPLEPQLEQAIFAADLFLFVDSTSARISRWVRFELSLASKVLHPTQIVHILPEYQMCVPEQIVQHEAYTHYLISDVGINSLPHPPTAGQFF